MARARPVILYLSKTLPHEKEVVSLLMALPKGERTKFVRQVIVLGREAKRMDEERAKAARKAAEAQALRGDSDESPATGESHHA